MKNVLIVSGHTDLNDSVVNKTVLEELRKALPEAEFDILSEEYPDFRIDVKAEQKKVEKADIMVWQFPVFWYSMPSLLRRWIEQVIVHGFAYGSTGHATDGTKLIASFTTGAPAEAYSKEGAGFTIEELMGPQLQGTANLCSMDLQPFVYTGGVSYALRTDPEKLAEITLLAKEHAARLIKAIKALE